MSQETRPYKFAARCGDLVVGDFPQFAQFQNRRDARAFRRELIDLAKRWFGQVGDPRLVERMVAAHGGILGPMDRLLKNAGLVGRER